MVDWCVLIWMNIRSIDMKLQQINEYLFLVDEHAERLVGSHYISMGLTKQNVFIWHTSQKTTYPDEKGIVIAYYPLAVDARELDLPLLPNPITKLDWEVQFNKTFPKIHVLDKESQSHLRDGFFEGYMAAQMPTGFICEYDYRCFGPSEAKMKFIANAEGKQEIVGKYIK